MSSRPQVTLMSVLVAATQQQRQRFLQQWLSKIWNITNDADYANHAIVQILQHNGVDDLLNFLTLQDDDLGLLNKPNPTAGQPDLPLGVVERKIIQAAVSYYHKKSNQAGHLKPNSMDWTYPP